MELILKLIQVAIAFDQFIGTIVLDCDADETMSAKFYRCKDKNKFYAIGVKVIDKLFFWQDKHCYKSFLSELDRKQLPQEYQQG